MVSVSNRRLYSQPDVLDLRGDYPEIFALWCECVDLDDTICMLSEEDGNEEEIEKLRKKCDAIWRDLQLARKLIQDY